jgi:hypothetical protein
MRDATKNRKNAAVYGSRARTTIFAIPEDDHKSEEMSMAISALVRDDMAASLYQEKGGKMV